MEGYDESTYGERFADVYDEWYGDDAATMAAAGVLADLAGGAAALELGVGTGRLALVLAGRGVAVTGVDASPAMLERLGAKPGATGVDTRLGDMAGPLPDGPYGLVYVARNTFFNLTSDDAQRRCLREVGRVLAADGAFVAEAFVPEEAPEGRSTVEVRDIGADRVLLFVDRHDPMTQDAWSTFVEITPTGVAFRPCHVRYRTPAQLDEMAAGAGLVLTERWAGWDRAPFDDDSTAHVSVYRHRGGDGPA